MTKKYYQENKNRILKQIKEKLLKRKETMIDTLYIDDKEKMTEEFKEKIIKGE